MPVRIKARIKQQERKNNRIMQDQIKRAKLRAMHLLTARDYTEHNLRDKLIKDDYPEEVVDAAIEYVSSYGYIDDRRYADSFVRSSLGIRSSLEITRKLVGKGVSREIIEEALAEGYDYGEGEDDLIRKLIKKKCKNADEMDNKQRQKLYSYMYGKGFSIDRVGRILDEVLLDIKS